MGFLDSIEKLITEHGSAAILRERIDLLNDRHAELERKCSAAEADRDALRADNAALRAQVEALKTEAQEVRRLQEEADRQHKQQLAGADRLPADREAVLRVICFHPDLSPDEVAGAVGLSQQVTQWHLDALSDAKLAHALYTVGTPWSPSRSNWNVTSAGRNYLASHGMLTD